MFVSSLLECGLKPNCSPVNTPACAADCGALLLPTSARETSPAARFMLLNIAALGLLVAPHRVSVHRAASAQMGLYDLSATRIDGASVAMSDFKGKPLVVVVRKH